jgi:sugar lactone lactonase YvrE
LKEDTMKNLVLLVPTLFLVLACRDRTPDQPDLRVIAEGAALHGANGINFGPDGNLYVASVFGMEIVAMNPGTGQTVDRLGPEAGVEGPDDLVFGPDGSLYWTDIMKGEVGRRTPGGVVTKQMVAPGVNPITFSPDGRLFTALDFMGDGLYELDPELMEAPRPIIVATPENPYPLGFLNGFAFGPDGRLYGPIVTQGLVVSMDVDSCHETSTPWEDCDLRVVAAGFRWPAAAKFDPQGRLHVVDQTGEVFRVDIDTGEKTVIAILEPGLDNLAFDSGGSLYVSSADHGWVAEVLPDGQARTISPGGMIVPMGVAVLEGPDGGEAVFVADAWRLREFDGHTGRQEGVYKGYLIPEVEPHTLTTPMSVSADGDHLVVSSWLGGAVQVWDPRTDRVLEHYPMPVPLNAIRFRGDLVVADFGLGGVVWASDHGMILPSDGVSVLVPAGLATNGDVLWVADWATGTVWQIGFDGRAPLDPVPVASGLANPEGMAVDLDGSLLVVETGAGRLSRIDLATGAVSVVTDGLEPGVPGPEYVPPTGFFDGVAVGPSGAIYLTDNVNNTLLRIGPR